MNSVLYDVTNHKVHCSLTYFYYDNCDYTIETEFE